jgi:hypothetical protein
VIVDREITRAQELMLAETPAPQAGPQDLADYFAAFSEWEFLDREDRRRVLTSMAFELRVITRGRPCQPGEYRITGVSFLAQKSGINEKNPSCSFVLVVTFPDRDHAQDKSHYYTGPKIPAHGPRCRKAYRDPKSYYSMQQPTFRHYGHLDAPPLLAVA